MLELRVSGETHPKTFTLVTDDCEGELARIQEILVEVDALTSEGNPTGDPIGEWFAATDAAHFADGAVIPQEQMAQFVELLEGDWPDAYEVFVRERRDAYGQTP